MRFRFPQGAALVLICACDDISPSPFGWGSALVPRGETAGARCASSGGRRRRLALPPPGLAEAARGSLGARATRRDATRRGAKERARGRAGPRRAAGRPRTGMSAVARVAEEQTKRGMESAYAPAPVQGGAPALAAVGELVVQRAMTPKVAACFNTRVRARGREPRAGARARARACKHSVGARTDARTRAPAPAHHGPRAAAARALTRACERTRARARTALYRMLHGRRVRRASLSTSDGRGWRARSARRVAGRARVCSPAWRCSTGARGSSTTRARQWRKK